MWLAQPSDTWPFETNCNSAEQLVENVNVVNNPAEWGSKMMSDFANNNYHDSQQRDYLRQAVDFNRKTLKQLPI
jgi:hypothetical protein